VNQDDLTPAIQKTKEARKSGTDGPAISEALAEGLKLIERSRVCFVGTNGEDGFPNIKAMLNLKRDGMKKFWFSTNTSSKRVKQIRRDNRACVYYADEDNFHGLMLTGTMAVLQDLESRRMLWAEGNEVYYPLGVEDPDYSVLCFTASQANYYHNLKNITFAVE
jgi:general stress protein 26